MSLLSEINVSADIKKLNKEKLNCLAEEIRQEIISVTEQNGGHLSSNLGIVETTMAIHYCFDLPKDKVIFDVGHQCYTHKILSERKDKFSTIRKDGGLSGFPDIFESEYDVFSTGHAGTSVSAGLGLCLARDKKKEDNYVINVVGDGSLVNGLNLEALLSTQEKPKKYILILNDNGMSISKNGNGFYRFLSKRTINNGYIKTKRVLKKIFGNSFITKWLLGIREFIKRVVNKRNYFEQFGFKYIEVMEGNDASKLIKILSKVKNLSNNKAVFLHVHTIKGKGLKQAEERADFYHGVSNVCYKGKSFGFCLGEKLNSLIEKDKNIIAITAGMKDGTGLSIVEKAHPSNFIDVGIAEEYAVTLSAGMAKGGLKPIVCIYSTFLQRAYDQILHDVCIQNLPVVFMLDRAGLVGEDGKTHQGVFDISYLSHIPNLTIFSPASTSELEGALEYALTLNSPVAIRYPKNQGEVEIESDLDFSRWQRIYCGDKFTILAVGHRMVGLALELAKAFEGKIEVVNARVIKPLDVEYLSKIQNEKIITLEENSVIGGFGSLINGYYSQSGKEVFNFGIKDEFVAHGEVKNQLKKNGLVFGEIKDFIKGRLI